MEKSSKSLSGRKGLKKDLPCPTLGRSLGTQAEPGPSAYPAFTPSLSRLTLAMACEDTGSNATDVLLPDTGVVHLRPQARH